MVKKDQNQFRPPIVTLMGHIDHGKTTLLDKIRSTNLWKKEAGGITQHIGAYQVSVKGKQSQSSTITFIDTPGHAAFVNMRQTGSQVTDLVVLVISATEGIQAQTKESIKIIQKNKLPFIVVINKIDLKNASPDKVKGQLVELDINPEDYGGQTACIPISAKTGQGIDKLLEIILLNAEIMELKNLPSASLKAFIIESKLDKTRGPLVHLVVKKGTLKVGNTIYHYETATKIKALIDTLGQHVEIVTPGQATQVLGFSHQPTVGSLITDKATSAPPIPSPVTLSSKPKKESVQLPVIIKADTQGTLEALLKSFSDDVLIIHSGIGPISDNDIFLAESSNAQVFAFDVKSPQFIKNLAKNQQVRIFESSIIYEIIDDINNQVLKLLEPTIDETIVGEGTIIAEFDINKLKIAGVKCTKGELAKNASIHLKRGDKIIKDAKINNIRQGKIDVDKIKSGTESGISFSPSLDFKIKDVIISYYKTENT